MPDELHGDGHSGDVHAVETALSAAADGQATDVEWWAHRLLGPESRSVTVYRGAVDETAYFVILDDRDGRAGTVYPASTADSVAELFATYRGDTEPGLVE